MKDRERFLFSAGITLVFYLLLFIVIDVFNLMKIEDLPEYYGPMTIELDDSLFDNEQGNSSNSSAAAESVEKSEKKESFKDLMDRFMKSQNKEESAETVSNAKETLPEKKQTAVKDNAEKVDDAFKVEKSDSGAAAGTGDREVKAEKTGPSDTEESMFDDSVFSDLDALASSDAKSSDAEKTINKSGSGSSSRAFDFEGLPSERSLIPPVASPLINNKELSRLPGSIYIVVSCLLTENGFLTALNIDNDSGYPQIAASVLEAVRTWHFEKAPGAGNIKLKIRYKITVR